MTDTPSSSDVPSGFDPAQRPTFQQLLEGAKLEVSRGRGAVNCTYTLAAEGKAYPRTCQRCGLGPCAFKDYLIKAYLESIHNESPTQPQEDREASE